MKRIGWIGAALLAPLALGACGRDAPRPPQAAIDACRSPRALLAVRRLALREAADQGVSAALLARIRRDAKATLEDPEVRDYDQGSGAVSCAATLRLGLEAPDAAGQSIVSTVAYDAEPRGDRPGYRYRLTDPGQILSAIASLGPLPPEAGPPPASSAAANAVATTAPAADEEDVRDDAAAAGDTRRIGSRPAAPPKPPH